MNFEVNKYLPDFTSEEDIILALKNKLLESFKCNYVSLVTNGTHAIEVVMRALQLKRGTAVIVPDISFIATATALANCGLIPVYADVSEEYFGVTLESVKKMYTENVSAVIVVHWGGFVNREIFAIKEFCKEKDIYLIEDCAQVFPCSIEGKRVGTIGDAGTFSFQTSKIVHCGEGGLITTNSADIARKCEVVLNWGLSFEGVERNFEIPSSNFRMSAIQCYFILKQLDMIDDIVAERYKKCDEFYNLCKKNNIEPSMPLAVDHILDCPFFFPIKSKLKLNTIEPRGEYPMRKSKMVVSILKWFYEDLVDKYYELNHSSEIERSSDRIVENNDFINIINSYKTSVEYIMDGYKK